MDKPISGIRREYALQGFDESQADPNPFRQFDRWFDDVMKSGVSEPNAMSLATVDADGRPSNRMILLKGFDERGFVFYTNYESRKGRALEHEPRVAACFWWPDLERQVRIEGDVERVTLEESDAYFESRPRESQIGACVSNQSSVVASRGELEIELGKFIAKHIDRSIPRPDFWGGFRIRPRVIEFWQGRPHRLHDRLRYTKGGDTWKIERLAP